MNKNLLYISICLLTIGRVFGQDPVIQSGMLYIKLNQNASQRTSNTDNQFQFSDFDVIQSYEQLKNSNSNQRTTSSSVLDGIYKVEVSQNTNIQELCKELAGYDNVIYAEPIYQEQLLYIPSDPDASNGNQSYLEVIQAFDAWDITKGDSSLVIGIIDTGVDRDHPDIYPKIYLNEGDPPNGVDDDGNGYIDDYWGYDFADQDSIPQAENSFHGNRVAGLAGAATDNTIGIAGVGFYAKIRPLKIFTSEDNSSAGAYEAIIYAADNGYDVINLSWGSAGSYSQANEDIINYAVLEKNVVIIAAAGNTPSRLDFYPASYTNVLSVAATNNSDEKASFSTYSYEIDLCAPGNAIYSTFQNSGYASDNGTSYSSPMVAGTAALVKSAFPSLSAEQIRERIRVTTDDIYDTNTAYQDLLGSGRLNTYRAVTDADLKSVRLQEVSYNNGQAKKAFYGDTIRLSFTVKNYLSAVDDLSLSFTTESSFVSFLTESLSIGTMATGESQEFEIEGFVLSQDIPTDTEIDLRVGFSDGTYSDFQYIHVITEPNEQTLDNANLQLTISGRGVLGANSNNSTNLAWQNAVVASEMGLAVGSEKDHVSDNLPDTSYANDFANVYPVKYESHPEVDYLVTSTFSDDSATSPSGLIIDQKTITNENADFLIQEYRLGNSAAAAIDNLKAGFYINWDLSPYENNRAYFLDSLHTLIAKNSESTLFSGVRSYQDVFPIAQAINLSDENGNAKDIDDLMTDSLVFSLMDTVLFDSAGWNGSGTDIATLITQDSITIQSGKSQRATFFFAISDSYEEMMAALDSAQSTYERFLQVPSLLEQILSCRGASLTIDPSAGTNYQFYSDPFAQNLISENDTLFVGEIYTDTSFYAINIDETVESEIYRIDVKMVARIANFSMEPDTLLLTDGTTNAVAFTDESFRASSWNWDFDNGLKATIQNPTVAFSEEGSYEISLEVVNELGCADSYTQTLLIVTRPDIPQLSDQEICNGETVVFATETTDSLAVYVSETAKTPIATGKSISLTSIVTDTTFYISRIEGPYESLKIAIQVLVSDLIADITYQPDLESQAFNAVFLSLDSGQSISNWYLDGALVSTAGTFSLSPEKDTYEVSLAVTNELGCKDSTYRSVTFSQSPTPQINLTTPCTGDSLIIAPENGQYFGFYSDSLLTDLIVKSATLLLPALDTDTTLYLVGLDSIYPSEVLSVAIVPENITLSIIATPDTLYLSEQKTAKFAVETEDLVKWRWFKDSVFIETTAKPTLYFDEEATYVMALIATSSNGCEYSSALSFEVYDAPESILSLEDDMAAPYPNPTDGYVFVPIKQPSTIMVHDLSGQLLQYLETTNNISLNLNKYPKGQYLISIKNNYQIVTWKVILN